MIGSQWTAWAAGLGLLAAGAWLFLTPHDWATLYERDLPAYQSAIRAFAAGHDPYQAAEVRRAQGLPFIAPPFVWLLYKWAAHSPLKSAFGWILAIAGDVSVAALPIILSRLFLGPGPGRIALGAGFFFTAFFGAGFFTALVMNNGTPLYALIAAGLIPAVTRGRWLAFHLAMALATAFKPFYAAFWLVPLLADAEARRQWRTFALGVGAAAMAYVVPLLAAPRLMAAWLRTLTGQMVGVDRLGDNLLGAMAAGRHAPLAPYEAQAVLSAVLLGEALLLDRLDRRRRIAGLLLAAVFLNPRAMRYDLCFAAIPLLAIVCGAAPSATTQALWALILAGVMTAFSRNTPADGFLYAGIAVAALFWTVVTSGRKAGAKPSR